MRINKLIPALTLAILVLSAESGFAQLTAGSITYKIEMSSDDPDMAAGIAMMGMADSRMRIDFDGDKTRTNMSMGGMMEVTTIMNTEAGQGIMLMGGMMGKMGSKLSAEQIEELENEDDTGDLNINITEETKDILGFKCTKVIVSSEDTGEVTFWCTNKIKLTSMGQNYNVKGLPGHPLEFGLDQDGMTMSFTATEIGKTKPSADMFNMVIPEGYTEVPWEQLKNAGQN